MSAGELEVDLQRTVRENEHGSRLEHVTCVHEDGPKWRCTGKYTASVDAVREGMGSIDTSNFTGRDWQVLVEQASGPVTFVVTVGDDGEFTYEPSR